MLSTITRKAILLNNLYGVDLDAQAVEVTKLSLLLKCLEGETRNSAAQQLGIERLLPTIDHNVKVGNSLVEPDFYDEFEFDTDPERPVRPFAWRDEFKAVFKQGGFDAVIGNPPWVDLKGHPEELIRYYFTHFTTASNRINLYALFLEKALRISKAATGTIGFIIPNSLLYQSSFAVLRRLLLNHAPPTHLVRLPDNTFDRVKAESLVVIAKPGPAKTEILLFDRATTITEVGTDGLLQAKNVNPKQWSKTTAAIFDIFSSEEARRICAQVEKAKTTFEDCCDFCLGLTPYDKYKGHTESQIKNREFHANKAATTFHKPLLAGSDITPFLVGWRSGEYIKYGPWLGAPREQRFFTQPRLLVRQIISGKPPRIFAGYTEDELYNTQSVFNILLKPTKKLVNLKYLLGILNSKLMTFYHANKFLDQSKTTYQKILIQDCKKFPVALLDAKNRADYNAIITEVEKLEKLQQQQAAATVPTQKQQLQRQLMQAERRLDQLVYNLYQLTKADIEQVEAALG